MISIQKKDNCSGCHSCAVICPKSCITMCEDNEGFWYPNVNEEHCIQCDLCETHCPILNQVKLNENPHAYAAYSLDEDVRMNSSSGGVFSHLSKYILEKNGIIYGAILNERNEIVHDRITNENGLSNSRGSKYVQSRMGNIYKLVKIDLIRGHLVYFSGTPCQIDGLKSYLGKDYDMLVCQDIICHGVPSPIVWKKYLNRFSKDKSYIKINFRDKSNGWHDYNFSARGDYTNLNESHRNNIYMNIFLKNLSLRPSCFECHSKAINRSSDITLGDFWGVENFTNIENNDTGISLLIINSRVGNELLEAVKSELFLKEVDLYEAIKYNPSMTTSVDLTKNRQKFFFYIQKHSLEYSYYMSNKIEIYNLIKLKLKHSIKKILCLE